MARAQKRNVASRNNRASHNAADTAQKACSDCNNCK